MNELQTQTTQLPETLPELSKFVLVGREKLAAVRAEINAIKKVGLAKEVLEQKKAEAQEIAELVTLSEVRIGEMLLAIPKVSGGDRRSEDFKNSPRENFETYTNSADPFPDEEPEVEECEEPETDMPDIEEVEEPKTKTEFIKDLGFTPKQTHQFQTMAKHEDVVREVIDEARKNDDVVSRTAVLKKIENVKKPHVVNNSTDNEWYTPEKYIELAREVMGSIDLDPASNDFANKTVKANRYYTEEEDGLKQEWFGNIWMNPPYSTALLQRFAEKLTESKFKQAIVLVNNATETAWFEMLVSKASAIVFHKGRIRFVKRDGEHGSPLQGQAFIYYGDNADKFLDVFGEYGWGAKL